MPKNEYISQDYIGYIRKIGWFQGPVTHLLLDSSNTHNICLVEKHFNYWNLVKIPCNFLNWGYKKPWKHKDFRCSFPNCHQRKVWFTHFDTRGSPLISKMAASIAEGTWCAASGLGSDCGGDIVFLRASTADIMYHASFLKIGTENLSEASLIASQAAAMYIRLAPDTVICTRHRAALGLRLSRMSKVCHYPSHACKAAAAPSCCTSPHRWR